jgi:hypothetical protein
MPQGKPWSSNMSHQRLSVLFAFFTTGISAQWVNFPTPGVPRTRDGKPNLSAPAPRTAEGKPDLSGVWMHEHDFTSVADVKRLFGAALGDSQTANAIIDSVVPLDVPGMEFGTQHRYSFDILIDIKPGESPLRPEAAEIMRRRAANTNPADPCGDFITFPNSGLLSEPIKIIQSPRVTAVLYEVNNLHRQIFTDGRALPKEFNLPAFLGYSIRHWEGDVLVVETAGFNDKTALDGMGHPHSEALRITERFRRSDFGHMGVEMTFDDPQIYTKPFTIRVSYDLLADADIFEMFCNENEKDGSHSAKR